MIKKLIFIFSLFICINLSVKALQENSENLVPENTDKNIQDKNFIKDIELTENTENLDDIGIEEIEEINIDVEDINIPKPNELTKLTLKEIFNLIKLQASKVSFVTYAGITIALATIGGGCAYLILRKKR
ncbi:hypothetical protein K9L05_00990 [Candidatus Babeliales bacterium]|nr:hypothetical protein [Candidatus Babeliales bacterium]MCF7899207.1 hypothetical protein [Candidatus Babeliales bacterium]